MATPQRGTEPTADDDSVTKEYVDDLVGGAPVFIQQTEPVVTGPAVWYQIDGSGNIIDIKVQTS